MKKIDRFVRVSPRNPRYFELDDGTPYIPVGVNLCFQRFLENDEEILAAYRAQFEEFGRNGGNFARIWMGVPFLNLEPEKPGVFSEKKLDNLRRLIAMAKENGIRLKLTLEHFRTLTGESQRESFPGAANFNNPVYRKENGGFADTMQQFMTSPESKRNFIAKLELLSRNFADEPAVIGWELWNEVNCVGPIELWKPWTEEMLAELRQLFPKQLALQSLGSFSDFSGYRIYDALASLRENAFLQAHRYIDPGAAIDICKGPMDLLCHSVTNELLCRESDKPVILAETGAVEFNHSGPSHLYESDSRGELLVDALYAPFFSGSAGCGQFWHWDYTYIGKHNLWHHFSRFAALAESIDPLAESFQPFLRESHLLRYYTLKGKTTDLVYFRSKGQDELAPETLELANLTSRRVKRVEFFPLWDEKPETLPVTDGKVVLPAFRHSGILKIV